MPQDYWYTFPAPYTLFEFGDVGPALTSNPLASASDRTAYVALLGSVADRLQAMRQRLADQDARGIRMTRRQIPRGRAVLESFRTEAATWSTVPMPQVATLAAVDQIGVAQDALALARAGDAPGGNLLDIVSHVPPTAQTVVWERIADMLATVDQAYGDRPARAAFRRYAVGRLRPALVVLGGTPRAGEAADVPVARARLIEVLGALGDDKILSDARTAMASGGTSGNRRAAQMILAAKADAATFDALLAQARATDDPLQKLQLYKMLAGVEDDALSRRMVPIVLGDEVPAGTNASLIVALARAHPLLVWKEVVPHLADPKVAMAPGVRRSVAATVVGLLDDPATIPAVRAYVEREVSVDARRPFDGAIAAITVNSRVATRMLPELDRWIADHAR